MIPIQITVDLTSQSQHSPYTILEASLSGDICTSPQASQWQVIEGYIGEPFLVLAAQRVPLTHVPPGAALGLGTCANGITIIGIYKEPSTYAGIYAFEGEPIWSHDHTTLFKGWQAC